MRASARRVSVPVIAVALAFAAFSFGYGQERTKVRLNFASTQAGSPVSLLSVNSGADNLFNRVTLRNLTSVRITSITFGVVVHPLAPKDSPTPTPVYEPVRAVPVSIAPGEVTNVDHSLITRVRVLQLGKSLAPEVEAEFGVVRVDFENGTAWEFDPISTSGFGAFIATGVRFVPCGSGPRVLVLAWLSSLIGAPVSAQGHFKCVATSNCLVCTNTGSNCSMSICGQTGNPPCINCPQQVCAYEG